MQEARVGSLRTSIPFERREWVVVCTRVMSYVRPWGFYRVPAKRLNMERITMGIGQERCLLIRYAVLKLFSFINLNSTIQLRDKIIPAFEAAHGPGFQAMLMVDNSQGHSVYAENALVISCMNVRPGGKQARMHDTWFMKNGLRVQQMMVFLPNHADHLNEPKGMQEVLKEQGLYPTGLRGKCKKCPLDDDHCCCKTILA